MRRPTDTLVATSNMGTSLLHCTSAMHPRNGKNVLLDMSSVYHNVVATIDDRGARAFDAAMPSSFFHDQ